MKRVIDGKLYDTETAEQIANYCPNPDRGDFGFLRERLMATSNGAYFLACEGGAKTQYGRSTGDGRTGGKTIEPLTTEEALQWCEKREVAGDVVAEEFEDMVEKA